MAHENPTKRTRHGGFAAAVLGALLAAPAAHAQQLYQTPIWADDMAADERLHTDKAQHSEPGHPQQFGYDLLGLRHTGGRNWSRQNAGTSGNGNSTYVIYGKKVHAMAAGTVIACWRNAPPNPRAGQVHPEVTGKRIPLPGNFLWIQEDDGERVLYAHAIAGSIPSELCPYDATLLMNPYPDSQNQMPAATVLPLFNRPRVESGQFLMLAGNSGNSSEPHLHVHKIDAAGAASPISFRRGLYSMWTNGGADFDVWHRFGGNPIPPGPVVVWPPRRAAGEAAGHGFAASTYQPIFDHLSDSGFRQMVLDTYRVGGTSFLNFAWRPALGQWRASTLVSAAQFQQHLEADSAQGFDPVMVESSLGSGGQVLYSVTSVENVPGTWIAVPNLTYDQHLDVSAQALAANLSPASISVVSVNGERRYTVLYTPRDLGAWAIQSRVRESDLEDVVADQAQQGRHPVYVNAYMHGGDPYLSVIFAERAGTAVHWNYSMSGAELQAESDTWGLNGEGLFTRSVTAFDGAQQQHRFAAVWYRP